MPREHNQATPVTWLASYPRSGNTLLRVILKRCFGLASHSLYTDAEFSDPVLDRWIGHEPVGDDARKFLHRAGQEGRTLYVKTHELRSPDRHRAIYVVRDGRSAVVSHAHFLREILYHDVSLADVIRGAVGVSWSQHVRSWMSRPGTLILRYEDLICGDSQMMAALADFIGEKQRRAFDISFAQLHARDPRFFRAGSDRANIAEMDGEAELLFAQFHGSTLRELGYAGEPTLAGNRETRQRAHI